MLWVSRFIRFRIHPMPTTFEQIEEQKAALLHSLADWPAVQQQLRPPKDGWSAMQVIDHLAKTEREIQKEMQQGLHHPHRLGLRDRLGGLFLQRVFQSSRKVKVPASATAMLPDADPELTAVCAAWDASRRELRSMLATTPEKQRGLGLFRHPVAGWMTVSGVLDFFSVHMHHHQYQLAGLAKSSGVS